jgi:hypothetical protein
MLKANFKKTWSYTSTPPYVHMASGLIKHKDNFAFYFYIILGTEFQILNEVTMRVDALMGCHVA